MNMKFTNLSVNQNYPQTTEMRTDEGTNDQNQHTGSAEELIPDDTD